MATDTFIVIAASYTMLGAAEADYQAARDCYLTSGLPGTYDAAVIAKDEAGKVRVVIKHEQPARPGPWGDLGVGLAGGALVVLFPAVGTGAELLLAAGGGGLGALAGRVSAGLKRADVKDIGELLDEAPAGLVVVAARDLEDRLGHVIKRARKLTSRPLTADQSAIERDIEMATRRHGRSHEQAVAETDAAVAEAEAEAAAAERAAEEYSAGGHRRGGSDLASQLIDLARLRQAGVLSAAEFEAAASSLLNGRSW